MSASQGRGNGRRSGLLAAVTAAAIAAVLSLSLFAGSAGAAKHVWSSFLEPISWSNYHKESDCAGCNWTLATFMHADYNGEGNVHVCEQVQSSDGSILMSSQCANNHITSGNLQLNYAGYAKRVRIKNDSFFAHTIWGKIEY